MASPALVEGRRMNITNYLNEQAADVAAASVAPAAAELADLTLAMPKVSVSKGPPVSTASKDTTSLAADKTRTAASQAAAVSNLKAVSIASNNKNASLVLAAQQSRLPSAGPPAAFYMHQTSSVPEEGDEDVDDEDDGDDGGDTDSGEGLLYRDNVDLDSIEFYLPTAFTSRRHLEPIVVPPKNNETWRVVPKDRMKTVSVALVLCLNVGVDPPDVDKPQSCARVECWIDPYGTDPFGIEEGVFRPIDKIGNELEKQYKRWQQRAKYKQCLDPTTEDVKKLVVALRKNAKDERVLFHYNGHGVPKPTQNGEIWVFNKQYTQYIPLSIYDLASWVGVPAVYVFDCHNAGVIAEAFLAFLTSCDLNEQQQQAQQQQSSSADSNNSTSAANYFAHATTNATTAADTAAANYNNELLGVQGAGVLSAVDAAGEGGSAQQPGSSGSPTLGDGPAKPPTWRELREVTVFLCACSRGQELPMNAELPADLFTACLTTPIKMALQFFWLQNRQRHKHVTLEMLDRIPGQMQDRRTMLGELNWIFTAITDTIAWNLLPRELFQKLFRQDLLLASLFRNFLLAQRIMQRYGCTPTSHPRLPNSTVEHSMWDSWDLVLDDCFFQLASVVDSTTNAATNAAAAAAAAAAADMNNNGGIGRPFQNSSFFSDQLTAFQVWLECGTAGRRPPEQLPVILQVLLSHSHRLRALDLLGRFCDLGSWAVNQALSVGIFPYILKLLQATARELRPYLVFIWAKIMAVDATVQQDMTRENAHAFFLLSLSDQTMPMTHRTMAAFCLAQLLNGNEKIKAQALKDNVIAACLENITSESASSFRQWLALALGHLWCGYPEARLQGTRDSAHEKLWLLLHDPDAEVRSSCIYALRTYLATNRTTPRLLPGAAGAVAANPQQRLMLTDEHADSIDLAIIMKLLTTVLIDGSVLVRKELTIALNWFVLMYEKELVGVALQLLEQQQQQQRETTIAAAANSNNSSISSDQRQQQHKMSMQANFIYPQDYPVPNSSNNNSNNSVRQHKTSLAARSSVAALGRLAAANSAEELASIGEEKQQQQQPTTTTTTTSFSSFLPFSRQNSRQPSQATTAATTAVAGSGGGGGGGNILSALFHRTKSPSVVTTPIAADEESIPRVSSSSQLQALDPQQKLHHQHHKVMQSSGSGLVSTTSLTRNSALALSATLRKALDLQQQQQQQQQQQRQQRQAVSSGSSNIITYPPYGTMLTCGNMYKNIWRTLLYCSYDAYPELAIMAEEVAQFVRAQTTAHLTEGAEVSSSTALVDAAGGRRQNIAAGGGGDRNDSPGKILNRTISLQQQPQPSSSATTVDINSRKAKEPPKAATNDDDEHEGDDGPTPTNKHMLNNSMQTARRNQASSAHAPLPPATTNQAPLRLIQPAAATINNETNESVAANTVSLSKFSDQHLESAFADWCATYYANPLTGVEEQDDPLSAEYVRKKLRTQRNRQIRATFRATQQHDEHDETSHHHAVKYQHQMFSHKMLTTPVVTLFEDYRPYLIVADAECVSVWNWYTGLLVNCFANSFGSNNGRSAAAARICDMRLINAHDAPLLAVANDAGQIHVWRDYEENYAAAYAMPSCFTSNSEPTAMTSESSQPSHSSHMFGISRRLTSSTSSSSAVTGSSKQPPPLVAVSPMSRAAATAATAAAARQKSNMPHSSSSSSPSNADDGLLPYERAQRASSPMLNSINNSYYGGGGGGGSTADNFYYWGKTTSPACLVTAWNALPEIAFPASTTTSAAATSSSPMPNIAGGGNNNVDIGGVGIVTALEQKPRLLLMSGDVRFIRIWDMQQERKTLDMPTMMTPSAAEFGSSRTACVSALATDPNRAAMCVAGFGDGALALYDRRCAPSSAQVQRYAGHSNQSWVVSACIPAAHDDQRIYSSSVNGEVRVWEMRKVECVHKIPALPRTTAMHRHPNASILACGGSLPQQQQQKSGGGGNAVALYSTMGEQMNMLRALDSSAGPQQQRGMPPVSCLNFHPYRHMLAIGAGSGGDSNNGVVAIYSSEKEKRPLHTALE